MKRTKSIVLACMVVVGVIAIQAHADITMNAPDALKSMDHSNYFAWKITPVIPSGEIITGASLFFDDIRNWNNEKNELYISLLDGNGLSDGVTSYGDSDDGFVDNLSGSSGYVPLITLSGLTTSPVDITIDFPSSHVTTLNDYFLADGNFAIGLDPDCHYYNNGIALTLKTAPVPVPGAVLLGMLGLGVAGIKLRKHA